MFNNTSFYNTRTNLFLGHSGFYFRPYLVVNNLFVFGQKVGCNISCIIRGRCCNIIVASYNISCIIKSICCNIVVGSCNIRCIIRSSSCNIMDIVCNISCISQLLAPLANGLNFDSIAGLLYFLIRTFGEQEEVGASRLPPSGR